MKFRRLFFTTPFVQETSLSANIVNALILLEIWRADTVGIDGRQYRNKIIFSSQWASMSIIAAVFLLLLTLLQNSLLCPYNVMWYPFFFKFYSFVGEPQGRG